MDELDSDGNDDVYDGSGTAFTTCDTCFTSGVDTLDCMCLEDNKQTWNPTRVLLGELVGFQYTFWGRRTI